MKFSEQLTAAVTTYRAVFGDSPTNAAYAPGRVNLIGEHTDYNDGFVLPFALPFRTVIVGKLTYDKKCTIVSVCDEFSDVSSNTATFELNHSLGKGQPEWANYVKGTLFQYLKKGDISENFSFNAVIVSNVPLGSGLSSSAALEVATATFLENLCGGLPNVSGVERALRAQKAEHDFADTPCGIMDQYISSMGKVNK